MTSNIPTVVTGTTISSSTWGNVVKADVDILWDAWPKRHFLWHFTSTVTVGNAIDTGTSNASHPFWYWRQNTAALGDTFTNEVVLSAGTYTFYALGVTNTVSGQIDWTLGGASIGATQDWYSGSAVYNVTQTISGISVVTEPSRLVLQGTVSGTTGAAYGIYLSCYWFKRTSDT